jgi:hypothetical protein
MHLDQLKVHILGLKVGHSEDGVDGHLRKLAVTPVDTKR